MRRIAPSTVVLVVLLGLAGFAPLFGGPGYESALVAGVVAPSIVACSAAWRVSRGQEGPLAALARGASRGLFLGGIALLLTLLHGLRVGFCSAREGLLLFALGPLAGCLLAGIWGAGAGLVARQVGSRRKRLAAQVALALAGPVGSALISVLRAYSSPIVFAFDPFAGFFSGTLYDTVIDGTDRLLTYRLGSLASAAFALGLAWHLDTEKTGPAAASAEGAEPAAASTEGSGPAAAGATGAAGPGRMKRLSFRGWPSALTIAALGASLAVTAEGPALGHWQTTATIIEALGGRLDGKTCDVIYPATVRARDAELLRRDCEQQIEAASSFLAVAPPPKITAFFFADPGQKRRLMGAAETYVAKPWRREVYLQLGGYPHPVLGHEIAHVVAGGLSAGPLHVAGMLRGLLPDPGLIEGTAVATSPDDDELSPEAWSRVMLDLHFLPPLRSLFSLGFLGHDAGLAYTVAGAFVGWVHRVYGAEVLGKWYGGGDLPALTGQSWEALEAAFRAHLSTLPIPPEALALGKSRFDRPAVFGRRCPHEVDAHRRDASALSGAGDFLGALRALAAALTLDPRDAGSLLLRATCRERLGEAGASVAELEALLADAAQSAAVRDRADERLADLALASGDTAQATRRYEALERRILDEDHLRTLDVKLAAARDPEARAAVVALLIGSPTQGPDLVLGAEELGRWAERAPGDGRPRYLLGRNLLGRGQPERAAALLDQALDGPPIAEERVRREAARQRVFAGCILRDRAGVERGLRAWSTSAPPPGNRDALLRALAARCLR
jgi:tetratricopeptide (TPR) repeat protein